MKKIGFVGLGIMGKSMTRNLMKAGYELHIYARTKAKVEDVIGEGAVFYDSVGACAAEVDAMISIVGYPADVEEVYFGENGILDSAKPGTYVIDMTTSSPKLAKKSMMQQKKRGFMRWMHRLPAAIRAQKTALCRFLSAVIRRIMRHVMPYLKQWEQILIMKADRAAASIQKWRIRS